jgi:hypothetical protein
MYHYLHTLDLGVGGRWERKEQREENGRIK